MSLNLDPLTIALLRAAADQRLHRVGGVYHWRPRNVVTRRISTPHMNERCTQLVAFGLILPPGDGGTAAIITQRGRDALAAPHKKGAVVPDPQPERTSSSSDNPGRPLGKALTEAREKADRRGQTGRSR